MSEFIHLLVMLAQSLVFMLRQLSSKTGPLLPLTTRDKYSRLPTSPRYVLVGPPQPSPPLFTSIDPMTGATIGLNNESLRVKPSVTVAETPAIRRSRRRSYSSRSTTHLRTLLTPAKTPNPPLSQRADDGLPAPPPQAVEEAQQPSVPSTGRISAVSLLERRFARVDPRTARRPKPLRIPSVVKEKDEEQEEQRSFAAHSLDKEPVVCVFAEL